MSLRLEVSLLAACLRGQRPKSESLLWLCLRSKWIEALLGTIRILRTQVGNCRIWSDWKCNGRLPLVALALSGPEEALQWLLSQLLRYSFCGICGNELEGLALKNSRTKITFSSLTTPSPSLLLSLILMWWRLEGTSQFYVRISLIVVRNTHRAVHRHSGDECFPQWS